MWRAPGGSDSTRAASAWWDANRRRASTARISPRSKPTRCTGKRTPRASSTSTRSASGSAPSATAGARPVRVHVALTPAELGADLHSRTAVVIDVFRAATTVVTALAGGRRAPRPLEHPGRRGPGKIVARTTPKGTRALPGGAGAAATAVAGLVNVKAV